MAKVAVVVALWIGLWVFNAGALFPAFQSNWDDNPEWRRERCRTNLGAAFGFGMAGPFALPAAIFATGILEHGWSLRCK